MKRCRKIAKRPLVFLLRRCTETALQYNDRVIDHHADAEYQRTHRDNVQRKSCHRDRNQGHQNRSRNGTSDDQGRLIIAKEQENDKHGDDNRQNHCLCYIF